MAQREKTEGSASMNGGQKIKKSALKACKKHKFDPIGELARLYKDEEAGSQLKAKILLELLQYVYSKRKPSENQGGEDLSADLPQIIFE